MNQATTINLYPLFYFRIAKGNTDYGFGKVYYASSFLWFLFSFTGIGNGGLNLNKIILSAFGHGWVWSRTGFHLDRSKRPVGLRRVAK